MSSSLNHRTRANTGEPADAAFLQERVRLTAMVGAVTGFAFLIFRLVITALTGNFDDNFLNATFAFHAGGASCFLIAWLFCRSRPHKPPMVHAVEVVTFLGACVCYTGMAGYIPLIFRPELIIVIILGSMSVTRAIFIPSSTFRTLLITVLAGMPIFALTIIKLTSDEVSFYRDVLHHDPPSVILGLLGMSMWWGIFVLLSVVTSRVLYGLRKQLNAAQQLGQYTLERKLGEGGMGVVYRARHAMLQRPTAIKVLRPDRASEQTLERFEREVQRTAELTHPNTVTVYDYGHTPDGLFYYAMEYLDGANLEDIVAVDGPQPPARVVHWMIAVADALSEAHDIGLIHRDVKPANILVTRQGGVPDIAKIVDFGLVKDLNPEQDTGLTHTEALVGTPLYMAPEAIEHANAADARSDLYALGAVAYFLLTGTPVFQSESVLKVCTMHITEEPEAMSARLGTPIDANLEALVMACLAKDPAARPASAAALREQLLACSIASWTREDGDTWWRTHGASTKTLQDEMRSTTGETLAIDLARRPKATRRWMRKAV